MSQAVIPEDIAAAARALKASSSRDLHRLELQLARLVLPQAQPAAADQLALVERFLKARATPAELLDARQDCWTYIGSLACYCSVTDSLAAQAILCCLEPDESQHSDATLLEQVARVLRCGVPAERVLQALAGG